MNFSQRPSEQIPLFFLHCIGAGLAFVGAEGTGRGVGSADTVPKITKFNKKQYIFNLYLVHLHHAFL